MKIHLHFFIEEIMKKILLIAGSVFLLFLGGYYYHAEGPCSRLSLSGNDKEF